MVPLHRSPSCARRKTYRLHECTAPTAREGQRSARAIPAGRGREDARKPDRAVRGEGVRAYLHPPHGGAGATAPDRRRDARLRDSDGPARPPTHHRPRRDLAATALATDPVGGQEQGEVPEGPDEDDPPPGALLESAVQVPFQPSG